MPGRSERAASRAAMERSLRWLERCRAEFERIARDGRAPVGPPLPTSTAPAPPPLPPRSGRRARRAAAGALPDRPGRHPRRRCAARRRAASATAATGAAIAIGGLSVGESKPDMYAMLEVCDAELPRDRPRYLMGVGFPDDLVEGVRRGIDLFDCVAPTRMGRDGTAFTPRREGPDPAGGATAPTGARSSRGAAAPAARATTAPTCAISSSARRCSASASSRCTT